MTGFPTELDLRDLLAEEAFVRRLARGLLFEQARVDEARVDDAVQETWLAAIERPPRDPNARRGFLRAVVGNVARRDIRGQVRRRRREQAAARPEATPSVDDVLALEDRRRQVLDALRGLPDGYRDVVLLRYFEDLQPKDIADRLGVPAATVRTRLHRGLELLRETLDRRHGGDRAAWRVALAPLARPTATGLAPTTGLLGAVLGMKKSALVGIAAGFAIVLGSWVWFGGGGPPLEGTNAATGLRVAADDARPDRSPDLAGGRRSEIAAATDPVATGIPAYTEADLAGFRGRLLFADGSPAGAEVVRIAGVEGLSMFVDGELDPSANDEPRRGPRVWSARAVTEPDGTFLVRGLWPRANYALRAGVDRGRPTFRTIASSPAPGETVDLGDIQMADGGTLTGRVVDADGEPIAGAEVWAADLPGLVTAAVTVDRFEPRHGALLAVPVPAPAQTAAEFAPRARHFFGGTLFQDVIDDEVAVLVVDGAEWTRTAWDMLPIARTRTDVDGRFELAGVLPGGNLVVVRAAGHATQVRPHVAVRPGVTRDLGEIELDAGESLHGRIVDAAGVGIAGAEVRAAPLPALGFRGLAFTDAAVFTDSDGEFEVSGLPRGAVRFGARRGPGQPWVVSESVRPGDEPTLRLAGDAECRITITVPPECVLEDVALTLRQGPMLGELTRGGLQPSLALDDRLERAEGGFRIPGLEPGYYTVELRAPGCVTAMRTVAVPTMAPETIELERATPFEVVVVDPDGVPVPAARVYVESAGLRTPPHLASMLPSDYGLDGWRSRHGPVDLAAGGVEQVVRRSLPELVGRTDAMGRLTIDSVAAGELAVSALHPRLGQAASIARVPSVESIVIRLSGTGAVVGRVTEGNRAPRAGAWRVVARSLDTFETGMSRVGSSAMPAADGSFRIDGLVPGQWQLEVRPAVVAASFTDVVALIRQQTYGFLFDERVVASSEVVVTPGTDTRVGIDIRGDGRSAGTLRGRVLVDGAPAVGARVFHGLWFAAEHLATVGADGGFECEGVTAGPIEIEVRDADGTIWSGPVEVPADGVVEVGVDVRTGVLRGRVADPAGLPAAAVTVWADGRLIGGGSASRSAETDAEGRFELRGLGAGDWELDVRSGPMEVAPVAVHVRTGDVNPQMQLIATALVAVSGRVVGEGIDFAHATVFLHDPVELMSLGTSLGADGSFHIGGFRAGVSLEPSLRFDDGSTVALSPGPLRLEQTDIEVTLVVAVGQGR